MFRSRTFTFDTPLQNGPAIRAAEIEMQRDDLGEVVAPIVQPSLFPAATLTSAGSKSSCYDTIKRAKALRC